MASDMARLINPLTLSPRAVAWACMLSRSAYDTRARNSTKPSIYFLCAFACAGVNPLYWLFFSILYHLYILYHIYYVSVYITPAQIRVSIFVENSILIYTRIYAIIIMSGGQPLINQPGRR
nr:MAG TPA: hypothetical protein [Bacteriophage sp.]